MSGIMATQGYSVAWEGWYEGEKRPHQQVVEIVYRPFADGEVRINVYDSSLVYRAISSTGAKTTSQWPRLARCWHATFKLLWATSSS